MKVIFVRHGKDDDRYRGGWSELDLIEEGQIQAQKLADFIYEHKEKFNISKIISSDLPRAMSTAKGISDRLNIPIDINIQLREMNNGDLAGMVQDEALAKYPGLFFHTLQMNESYPNGECPLAFYNRIRDWFHTFLNRYGHMEKNIVVVTHGGVINIIYYVVKKLPWTNKNRPFKVSPCSLHILNTKVMQFEVTNYTAYLK